MAAHKRIAAWAPHISACFAPRAWQIALQLLDRKIDGLGGHTPNTVGKREFFSREEAGTALNVVVMSWRDDITPQVRARFKGFDILSRASSIKDGEPDLFVRGKEAYKANLNPENPLGTISSIEYALRVLDRKSDDELSEVNRQEKALSDYRAQLGKPFEHEAKLKDLLAKQAQLNACLDLDKHEAQIVGEPDGTSGALPDRPSHPAPSPAAPQPPA